MGKTFRKACAKLHLWLGLLSGIVVFIVCITGCLYAFKDEITDAMQPWRFVDPQEKEFLLPSRILAIADSVMEGASATAITYGEESDAVWVDYYRPEMDMSTVFIDPYDGRVLKSVIKKSGDFDFFRFVLGGHRTLWLPREIGSPIVGYSVLIFLITLITGIVLWWPRRWTRKALVQRLTMRRPCTFSKLNFDLHNVVGFYASFLLFILCFTGLIFSLNWFSKAVYGITSGGEELKPYVLPLSDTLQVGSRVEAPLDLLYTRLRSEEPAAKTFYFALPGQADGVFRVSVVHKRGSYYRTDNLFFDQYTLVPLKGSGPYAGKYTEASAADKFRRMNLEIHDGRIWGLPGKILMFFASLIGASLPLTGFIIWYRRHRKK
ncbi:PepSY domain-containing protein [Bacteroides fragilis]|uniref:PepSY-associated TM helix domain-containing protein n=1 Tax=Bacteroides fragilis TaxID=817 RepID=UPI00202FF770|nr:PepSY-associated TM helix domain-containing protein [Bacteroides fragilis]MCM0207760.1 PepSY domain-containing protein [Bacteroides fragilis]